MKKHVVICDRCGETEKLERDGMGRRSNIPESWGWKEHHLCPDCLEEKRKLLKHFIQTEKDDDEEKGNFNLSLVFDAVDEYIDKIMKQVALKSSVEFQKSLSDDTTAQDVVSVAQTFYDWLREGN